MLHHGIWLLFYFLEFYDFLNQYCSNFLEKKTTVRGLKLYKKEICTQENQKITGINR